MARQMKPEELLVSQVANLMKLKYPDIPFRFDQIDQVGMVSGKRNKSLHGKYSAGYPDMFIPLMRGGYGGLFLELKATATVPNTAHTRRQAVYHQILRNNGYEVHFACGFKEAKKIIKEYMKAKV